jgi:hypothetical protein
MHIFLAVSVGAVAVYIYAVVASVIFASLHEEALANMHHAEDRLAVLEEMQFAQLRELTRDDAEVFALLPAEEVVHVSVEKATYLTLRD